MTDEQLNDVARRVTATMYELGVKLKLSPADLASVVAVTAVNVGYWAHRAEGLEQLRNAADIAEKQLLQAAVNGI